MTHARIKRYYWIPVTIVVLIMLDQWTKALAEQKLIGGRVYGIIDGFFDFSLAYNTGAAFGLGRSWSPEWRAFFFLGVSCLAVLLMVYMLYKIRRERWWAQLGITMIIGGAIGNLIDRFRTGKVVDFIHFFYQDYHYPHFNIADSSICVGITLFATYLIWFEKRPAVG